MSVLLSKSKLKKYRTQQAITGDKCIPQKEELPKWNTIKIPIFILKPNFAQNFEQMAAQLHAVSGFYYG